MLFFGKTAVVLIVSFSMRVFSSRSCEYRRVTDHSQSCVVDGGTITHKMQPDRRQRNGTPHGERDGKARILMSDLPIAQKKT